MEKFGVASDHAGFPLKEEMKKLLQKKGYEVIDYGCFSEERVDYPDFAHALAHGIETGEVSKGIAVCGSGNGISMALNKHPMIRAALAWTPEIAALASAHNKANVLSLPGRFVSTEEAKAIVESFLNTPFEGGRHQARIEKIPLCKDNA